MNVIILSTLRYVFEIMLFHLDNFFLAAFLSQYNHRKSNDSLCCLVIDSGFSFTHIVPYADGKRVNKGLKR